MLPPCMKLIVITLLYIAALPGSSLSLWGQVASFDSKCTHWKLNPQIHIPALQEFTACFYLKLEVGNCLSCALTVNDVC